MNFETSIQTAIYQRLVATLPALVQDVHDHVPQPTRPEDDSPFPYVTIGADSLAQWDTDTEVGTEGTVEIFAWSRYRGRAETKQIQAAIYSSLHRQDIPVSGNHLIGIEWEYSDTALDPDGKTWRGIQRFRVTLDSLM